jgi:hypothetical protein
MGGSGVVSGQDLLDPGQTGWECKKGGYKEFGFKNQGRCIAFVNSSARDQ